jgi:hypothetical protein
MITIRESKADSKVTLVTLEATLKTPGSVYTISSEGPMIDSRSPFGGELFGPISWPVSRFRLAEGLLLEQQMFLPHDGSAVAVSWVLRSTTAVATGLVVRPFFSGCGPRSYRDVGFGHEQDAGGRLTWLPNVRGPKVVADTNGRYHDEPVRFFDCFCEESAASASDEDLITPGRFEFELGRRPAVLILSMEDPATIRHNQHIGVFLAGLMQGNAPTRAGSTTAESVAMRTHQPVIA